MGARGMVCSVMILATALSLPAATTAPSDAELQTVMRELNSDQYAVRQAAQAKARNLSTSLLSAVEAAARDPKATAEVKAGLEAALPELRKRAATEGRQEAIKATLAWQRAAGVEVYKKAGAKDAKWDTLAIKALDGDAGLSGGDPADFKAAYEAGCRDPLVVYRYWETGGGAGKMELKEGERLLAAVARDIEKSAYPAGKKLEAYESIVAFRLENPKGFGAAFPASNQVMLQKMLAWFPEITKEKMPAFMIRLHATWLMEQHVKVMGDREKAFNVVYPVVAKALPESAMPHVMKAKFYVAWAWDARGTGLAGDVKPEGFKLMHERLAVAEAEVQKAWEIDPRNWTGPTIMLSVELGQGKGRDVMEMWFKRAIENEPRNFEACSAKMTYLEPKWYGSVEEMLEFGRECLKTGTAESRLPWLLIDAHLRASDYAASKEEYFIHDEVWKDMRDAYEKLRSDKEYAASNPGQMAWDATKYVQAACYCKKWPEAKSLLQRFAENMDPAAVGGEGAMKELKRAIAEKNR